MRKFFVLLVALVLFSSHDLFLRLDTYFLSPDRPAQIRLLNGTFDRSENTIDRDRMLDVSLVTRGMRSSVDTAAWSEIEETTVLDFRTGQPGTYVAGVSTRARSIALEAKKFNEYLQHDGVLDELARRKADGLLKEDANERYSKHVKTIFQVGGELTDDWQVDLGYPIEFIPLQNPYALAAGDELRVQLKLKGRPLANHLVHTLSTSIDHDHAHDHDHGHEHAKGFDHSHDHADEEEAHHHHSDHSVRTDANGTFSVPLKGEGIYALRTIHMVPLDDGNLTHESNWATLTFEVGHQHEDSAVAHTHADGTTHTHAGEAATTGTEPHTHADGTTHSHHPDGNHAHGDDHDHEHEGFPAYVWWVGSLLLVAGLFFFFRRKGER